MDQTCSYLRFSRRNKNGNSDIDENSMKRI